MRYLILLLALISFSWSYREADSTKRKILVIPFGRFDFHTEIGMEDINRINGSSGEAFYNQVYAGICKAFILHNSEHVAFRMVDDEDRDAFRSMVRFGMKGNTNHFACFPENFPKSDMKKLLDEYECDYLLTVNWYRIQESTASLRTERVKKVRIYATHKIDCDLLTRECTIIMEHTGKKFEVPATEENIEKMGLKLHEMNALYHQMVYEVAARIPGLGYKW